MENYDLRQCFVPDLSGLHVRIYQFRELLRQHLPTLSAHLADLHIEPAYVSQWFLSFYAVTCPLPMLFRIYDVIFAEGASETIMRVALSLMRKNQSRILACTEMEDVMHLLLSRGLWDCYNYNADEFVNDFVAFSDIVTKERMAALEQGYREAKISSGANHRGTDAAQASADVTTAASRFLGRIWASSSSPRFPTFAAAAASASGSGTASTSSTSTLNPGLGAAASRPLSMLRRSTSKQSLASMEAASSSTTTSSAASVLSSVSTEATTISRDSAADDHTREAPTLAPSKTFPTAFSGSVNASKDGSKHLHSQIEDLLTALSELQRNHALLATQLQREKEEREDDRRAVRSLLDGLRKKAGGESEDTVSHPTPPPSERSSDDASKPTAEQLSDLLDVVEVRFSDSASSPRSPAPETKSQLRDDLARAREQLTQERARSKDYNRKLQEMEQEMSSMRDQLRESHAHVRNVHQEKQRLERQIHGMRMRASDTPATLEKSEWFPKASSGGGAAAGAASGLRELKLGRSRSTPSQAASSSSPYNNNNNAGKRASSILSMRKQPSSESLATVASSVPPLPSSSSTSGPTVTPLSAPTNENDALLLELVQAKTAEAVARQELEEVKQRLEQLRKAFGLAPGETPPALHQGNTGGGGGMGGVFGRLAGAVSQSSNTEAAQSARVASPPPQVTASNNASGGGGFWGWRR